MRALAYSIAKYVAWLDPNFLTLLGLILSLLAPTIAYALRSSLLAGLAASLALLMDALDGSVARLRGKASKSGALLDSVADRASDASITLAFYFLGCDFLVVYLTVVLSMMVSYVRARAESLGVLNIEAVGFMTRELRGLVTVLTYIVHHVLGAEVANYLLFALALAAGTTAVQRALYALRVLRTSEAKDLKANLEALRGDDHGRPSPGF